MKYQEGDKILVTATGEKGVVVEWINKKMLTIDVGGIQFPVYADQIDFPYFNDFTKKKQPSSKKSTSIEIPRKEKIIEKNIPLDGVHLSFFPVLDKDDFEDDVFSHYRVYLLNHIEDGLQVNFQVYFHQQKEWETKHIIPSLQEMYLFDLPFDRLNDQPKFIFIFSLEKERSEKASQFQVVFKPKPKQFLKQSEHTIKSHQASFQFLLLDRYPEKDAENLHTAEDAHSSSKPEDEQGFDLSLLSKAGFKVNPRK